MLLIQLQKKRPVDALDCLKGGLEGATFEFGGIYSPSGYTS